MNNIPKILFNGVLINIKITPAQLESNAIRQRFQRRTSAQRRSVFRSNSRRLIDKLATAYVIKPKILYNRNVNRIINNQKADYQVIVNLPELNIYVNTYAITRNKAWRLTALKVHRLYSNSIIYN